MGVEIKKYDNREGDDLLLFEHWAFLMRVVTGGGKLCASRAALCDCENGFTLNK